MRYYWRGVANGDFVFWNGAQWVRGAENARYYRSRDDRSMPLSKIDGTFLDAGVRVAVTRIGIGAVSASTIPRRNPSPRHADEIEAASKLQADFSGHEPGNVDTVKVADQRVFTPVGNLDGVLYTTTRDGKVEKYIHRFRRKSRPLLATSHDGTQLRILGGEFRFTEAGIVDE